MLASFINNMKLVFYYRFLIFLLYKIGMQVGREHMKPSVLSTFRTAQPLVMWMHIIEKASIELSMHIANSVSE